MKNILALASLFALVFCCYSFSSVKTAEQKMIQQRWTITSRCTASHDQAGTDVDTTLAKRNDYIEFRADGTAYCYFNGHLDTLEYTYLNGDSISFGDTPFKITALSAKKMSLYQNEEEANGDYNRIWIELSK